MLFDPINPVIDEASFKRKYWTSSEFDHLDGMEEMPPNMPEPQGFGFIIRSKVDSIHACNTVTSPSIVGFLVLLNCALLQWFSKKQNRLGGLDFRS